MAEWKEPDRTNSQADPAIARIILFAFVLTFILAEIVVFLMMSRRLPDFYWHLGGTHSARREQDPPRVSGVSLRRPVGDVPERVSGRDRAAGRISRRLTRLALLAHARAFHRRGSREQVGGVRHRPR